VRTAGLVILKDRKLLLAFSKNKQAFYLPGGKVETGETPMDALVREIKEELNIDLVAAELKFYTYIQAPAFGEKEGVLMEQDCYLQNLHQIPHPGAEIESIRYFDIPAYSLQPKQVPGVVQLMKQLKAEGRID
jgi:8-oxo-dGTP pyrophosphatase MutT (NUDIX family)